ncbi:uncharacterized protein LOC119350306 [Triticum dicoccoides]|uniref:uncharacterized protein LOC119350306 n=1 Tax=Triticum dicoccoides TaxID=85692 RepID=UPI00188FF2FE|nr:uncharacterized protein LOC119350306 [Triticum dicoccoides]
MQPHKKSKRTTLFEALESRARVISKKSPERGLGLLPACTPPPCFRSKSLVFSWLNPDPGSGVPHTSRRRPDSLPSSDRWIGSTLPRIPTPFANSCSNTDALTPPPPGRHARPHAQQLPWPMMEQPRDPPCVAVLAEEARRPGSPEKTPSPPTLRYKSVSMSSRKPWPMHPAADVASLWPPPSLTALHNPLCGHLVAAAGLQFCELHLQRR